MATETEEVSEGIANDDNVPCRLPRRGGVIVNRIGVAYENKAHTMVWTQVMITLNAMDFLTSEAGALVERPFGSLQANESSMYLKLSLEQTNQHCCLEFLNYKTQIYFGGRYLKYSRNVSQTYWIIDDERMGETSVEEIIGKNILPMCRGDNYKFHAVGREDIDVIEIIFTVL